MFWNVICVLCFLWIGLSTGQVWAEGQCSRVFSSSYADNHMQRLLLTVAADNTSRAQQLSALSVARIQPAEATRNEFLKGLYQNQIVDHSNYSRLLSDKYFQVAYLTKRSNTQSFFPRTLGLRDLLARHRLLKAVFNGPLNSAFESELRRILLAEFPRGFVIKPTAGYNTGGDGFYINQFDKFYKDFAAASKDFVGSHSNELLKTQVLGLTTGESWLVQDLIVPTPGFNLQEYRVHTYENKVVAEATESRWLKPEERNFKPADQFVQKFLNLLKAEDVKNQAWGLDVIQYGPDQFVIVEINTNRGQPIQWSGHMMAGPQLGAYVRHLEKENRIQLLGPHAETFRRNKANISSWIRKEGREQVHEDLKMNHPALARELELEGYFNE